jgi:hypothetical protein
VNLDVRNKFGQYEIAEDSEHTHIHENIWTEVEMCQPVMQLGIGVE